MKYDVIIIGSGLGGMACAHILSKAGKKILLLEKGKQPGGCLQSYRRNGLTFDTGFHYVGGLDEGQSLQPAFRLLGLTRLPWRKMDEAFDRILIGKQHFSFHQGFGHFLENLQDQFPRERTALRQYVSLLRQTEQQQRNILNPKGGTDLSTLFGKNAWQYLNETFRDPLLIQVLSATSLKMELRQETLPLFTFLHGNGSFIESSWRLNGPGSLITDSLISDIRAHGGEIVCNAVAEELLEKNRRLSAVRCADGSVYEGNCFISDVHPAVTCSWIKHSECLRNIYRRRITSRENTGGMLTVSLVVRPGAIPYFNWNQYLYRDADVWTFYRKAPVGGILVSTRPAEHDDQYLRQIDLLTPMPWERCARWEQTRIGHRGEEYEKMKRQWADECINLAESFLPDLRKVTEHVYVSTPLTYRDYTGSPQGSAYGMRKDCNNPMMTVLSPRTPIPNLLLTGQSLMLHGVQGVTMTALFTCAEILGKEYIWNQLK